MPKSHGVRKRTRDRLSKSVRARGISPVSRAIQDFNDGDMVHIVLDPSIHRGMPNPKFHGKTGKVLGRRGRAYLLEVRDGNAKKTVISLPEHLKPQN
ncbi:50S ribosomal protein L21e [Methanocrinis sp.]|uniref:50S ribosomal protein L21e n=1 Tax=Methanocrinis sp. TaxID=3101522 RepID=UPI003D122D2F